VSFLAEVMEAVRYTEAQNRMIIDGHKTNETLAMEFGRTVRQIQRQRKLLIEVEKMSNEPTNKPKRARSNAAGARPGAQPDRICTNASPR
jgi:hypothetical protein